jgi:hypothetical protein
MNTEMVVAIASILLLGAGIWAASLLIENLAKIVNRLIVVIVAIAILLVYLKFAWGIEPAALWDSIKHLPKIFKFST